MKVKELISKLMELDENAVVAITTSEKYWPGIIEFHDITDVRGDWHTFGDPVELVVPTLFKDVLVDKEERDRLTRRK